MSRLSGKDMGFMLGDLRIVAEEVTLNIEDGRVGVMSGGVPDGHVDGETKASGDITIDTKNFGLIIEAAKSAGSFKELDTFDMVFNGESRTEKLNIEAFGCLLKVSDLFNASSAGGEKLKHKINYEVTSKDFVRINGIPYLSESETAHLV